MAQNTMRRHGRAMTARRRDQLTGLQPDERALHGAFGKARLIGDHAQARPDRLPALSHGAAIEKHEYEKSGWLLIMSDKVAQQDIQDVIVHCYGLMKTRHSIFVPLYR